MSACIVDGSLRKISFVGPRSFYLSVKEGQHGSNYACHSLTVSDAVVVVGVCLQDLKECTLSYQFGIETKNSKISAPCSRDCQVQHINEIPQQSFKCHIPWSKASPEHDMTMHCPS